MPPSDHRRTAAGLRRRVALVVGNDHYPNLSPNEQLTRAVSDGRMMRDVLRELDFSVSYGENLDRRQMVDLLSEFTSMITDDALAFFFFAGHGVALEGSNYVLPTDIQQPNSGEESRLRNMSLSEQNMILDIQERRPGLVVTIIDACRNNPLRRSGVRAVGSERGLTRNIHQPMGVFSIYSAGFGQVALDSLGAGDSSSNSVFTRVFAPTLLKAKFHLADLIIEVREKVAALARSVGHEQHPAYYDQTLGGRIYLLPANVPPPTSKGPERGTVEPTVPTGPILSINRFEEIQDDFGSFIELLSRLVSELCRRFGLEVQIDQEALALAHQNWRLRRQHWLSELMASGTVHLGHMKSLAIMLDQLSSAEWITAIQEVADAPRVGADDVIAPEIRAEVRRNVIDGRGTYLALAFALSIVRWFESNRIDKMDAFEDRITVDLEHDFVVYLMSSARNEFGIFLILKALYVRD